MTVIVDTHTHVVSADKKRYPLNRATEIPGDWVREHPVTADELLSKMDAAGVAGAVLVQPRAAYGYDNAYVAQARSADPTRFANVAIVDMAAGNRLERARFWCAEQGVLGLRLFNIPPATKAWIGEPDLADFVRETAAWGVRLSVCVLAPDLPAIGALLRRVDEVPIAVDHCGFADLSAGLRSDGAAALAALAAHENLRLKVTTTFLEMAREGGLDPREVVEWLCEVFGAGRLMWGSDYPQHHREPYPAIARFGAHACERLSAGEQADFLGGTALRLWPELAPAS
jgi:L-fuconolactonase